ncbi:MAG: MlaD family protein [Arenicellales bacterium]|jgi:ABC-type transporter Mla subunit MlaD|nr:MlaD family protein [Arenicellales bacterium]
MKTTAYTPFEVDNKDRIVGFFVIVAVLLFLIGFLLPAISRMGADEGIPYHTTLDQTYGVAIDAMVSLRGVPIGAVTDIKITEGGMVRVDISLSRDYQPFYTQKSSLSLDTALGVNTILTGSGLILEPGKASNGPLAPGSFISMEAPQGFGSILEELDLVQIMDQITAIIDSVEELTAGLAQNQSKLYASLDNLQEVTANVAKVTQELPLLVASVEQSLAELENGLQSVNLLVEHTDRDLQATLKNAVDLTEQATLTLVEAESLFEATTPVMNQLPTFLITTDIALQSFTELSDQLATSWLLGGTSEAPSGFRGPTSHPHDDSLYESKDNAKVSVK